MLVYYEDIDMVPSTVYILGVAVRTGVLHV